MYVTSKVHILEIPEFLYNAVYEGCLEDLD